MLFAKKSLFLNFETSARWLNVDNKLSYIFLVAGIDFNFLGCSLSRSLV